MLFVALLCTVQTFQSLQVGLVVTFWISANKSKLAPTQVSFGTESYWDTILSLDSLIVNSSGSDDAAVESTEGPDSDDPSSIVNSSDRRLSSNKPQTCLTYCKQFLDNNWEWKPSSSPKSKRFGWPDQMGVEFAYDVGEWIPPPSQPLGGGNRRFYSSMKAAASGTAFVGTAPLFVVFKGGGSADGELLVNPANGHAWQDWQGMITLEVGGTVKLVVAEVVVSLRGLAGSGLVPL